MHRFPGAAFTHHIRLKSTRSCAAKAAAKPSTSAEVLPIKSRRMAGSPVTRSPTTVLAMQCRRKDALVTGKRPS